MMTRDPPYPVAESPPRDPSAETVDAFLGNLPEVEPSQWPDRLLMEIELIADPDELEAVNKLIEERITFLRSIP